jgi:hypothetical protein
VTTTEPGPQLTCPGCGSPDVDLGDGLLCWACETVVEEQQQRDDDYDEVDWTDNEDDDDD